MSGKLRESHDEIQSKGLGIQNLLGRMSNGILKKTPSPKFLSNLSRKLVTRGGKSDLGIKP